MTSLNRPPPTPTPLPQALRCGDEMVRPLAAERMGDRGHTLLFLRLEESILTNEHMHTQRERERERGTAKKRRRQQTRQKRKESRQEIRRQERIPPPPTSTPREKSRGEETGLCKTEQDKGEVTEEKRRPGKPGERGEEEVR